MTIRQRVRMRFRKEGDLRWISHRDLATAVERLFRRAGLALGLSEGFHPKPRISFPLALALGIRALDEVLEVELAEEMSAEQLAERLAQHTLPGLEFFQLRVLSTQEPKAHAVAATYEFPVPPERLSTLAERVAALTAMQQLTVDREGKSVTLNLATDLDRVEPIPEGVRFTLRVTGATSVRPREILAALGVAELEYEGAVLTRTRVLLASEQPAASSSHPESLRHEEGNAD